MKHLAQTEHNLHLYWLIVVQLGHPITADFCSSGKIAFFHLVLPYKVPELVITDCHWQPPVLMKHSRCCCSTWLYSRSPAGPSGYNSTVWIIHKITHFFNTDFSSDRNVDGFKHQETPFLPSSLLGKQGLERYFRPDACMLGIPKPFESHFVWASRFCKTLLIPDVSLIKTRKAIAVDRIFFRFPALASSFILCVSGLSSPTGFISSQR